MRITFDDKEIECEIIDMWMHYSEDDEHREYEIIIDVDGETQSHLLKASDYRKIVQQWKADKDEKLRQKQIS